VLGDLRQWELRAQAVCRAGGLHDVRSGRQPCETAADCTVNCEEGSCVTAAKACGKDSGITCQDLAGGNPECRQY
jgi:hypothetical protein